MPTAFRALWIAFAGFFLVAAGSAGVSGANPPLNGRTVAPSPWSRATARGELDKVRLEAKRWHADAELVWVSGIVDAEGFSNNDGAMLEVKSLAAGGGAYPIGWHYAFKSPSAQKRIVIRVYRGGLATSGETMLAPEQSRGEPGSQEDEVLKPLPPDFIDSDQVMAVARKNGFSVTGFRDSYKFHLELAQSPPASVKEPYCWQVTDEDGTSFFVSAKSGKLLAKVSPDH